LKFDNIASNGSMLNKSRKNQVYKYLMAINL